MNKAINPLIKHTMRQLHSFDKNSRNTLSDSGISKVITLLTMLLFMATGNLLYGQSTTNYAFSGSAGTFTPIAGTTVSFSDLDEGWANAIPVGFTFKYWNSTYTTVSVSTNGWMTFGQNISDAAYLNSLTSGGKRPLVAPLWDDLLMNAETDFSYETTGSAGVRIFTAQWLNMNWDFNSTGPVISFQVKLYEATGKIEFIYQQEPAAVSLGSASIGIAASASGSDNFLSLDGTGSSPSASTTNETATISTKPGTGQVYSFTPAVIALSSPSQVANGNAAQGSTNVSLSFFQADVTNANAVLNSLTFTSAGDATSSDITNFKLYYSSSSTFPGGGPLSTISASTGAGSHTFSGLSQVINSGTTGYFWIVSDISGSAGTGRTINIAADPALSFAAGTPTGTISAGGTQTIVGPAVTISSPNPAAPAGNIVQNTVNNVIYRLDLSVTIANATLTGLTITTTGTYVAADLSNLQAWYSTDATFSPATDRSLSKKTKTLSPGTQSFPAFSSQTININTTGYIFITADVPCTSTAGATLAVNAVTSLQVFLLSGTVTGSTFAGGTQTVIAATPSNVTAVSASAADASSILIWTNPTNCFDEIMIVAKAAASITGIPSGNGSAYTANLAFGSGTAFDGGFVVYKGIAPPQTVTGLTNGTLYYYKFFVRKGSNWSPGIETSATPVTPFVGDFRSAATGNWNSTATWQYYNGSAWVAAAATPNSSSGRVTVRNGHNITVGADVTVDEVTVDVGGTISVNNGITLTLADGPDAIDCSINGTLINSGTVTTTGALAFNSASTYRHTQNGGTIPAAAWNATSTCNIIGITSTAPSGLSQTFGNFIWDCTGQLNNLSLVGPATVSGTFTLTTSGAFSISPTIDATYANYVQTGSTYLLSDTRILNVTNFSLSGGQFTMSSASGTGTLNVSGNFSQTAGQISPTSPGTGAIVFNGSTVTQTFTPGGTVSGIVNLTINTGAILQIAAGAANATSVTNNGTLTISPNVRATFPTVTNNGTLNLNSTSGADIFSLIMDTYSGTGTANVQLFLTGGGSPNYNWHYVAVPQDGLSTSFFTSADALNLMAYNDSRVTTSDFNGWSWHDGFGGTPGIAAGGDFSTLSYGRGYNFYHSSDATVNLTGLTSLGTTLGSAGVIALQYSGSVSNSPIYGLNLLGNSLTCSLNWDAVTFTGAVLHAVYFTTGNKWATYLPGSGGVNGATKDIPPLQGFFVKADATGGSITIPSVAREHSAQARYKKSLIAGETSMEQAVIYPKVKLELNGNSTSDETIVWFNNEATTGRDQSFDAYKLFSSEASLGQLYSSLEGNNYAINGIPLPYDAEVVPLGVKIAQAGSYSILKKDLVQPDGFNILLIDKGNSNFTVDLKNSDSYSFTSAAGTFNDRFILKFTSITTQTENPLVENHDFNIYAFNRIVNIVPMNSMTDASKGEVKIYDLTGRIKKQLSNIEWHSQIPVQVQFNEQQGIYIVEVTSGNIRSVHKIFLH